MIPWLRRWGYFIAFVGGALVVWLVTRKQPFPQAEIKRELNVIEADAEASRLIAEKGHEAAVKEVQAQYEQAKSELDDKTKQEAEMLKNEPVALSRLLVRAAQHP